MLYICDLESHTHSKIWKIRALILGAEVTSSCSYMCDKIMFVFCTCVVEYFNYILTLSGLTKCLAMK